MSCDGLGYMVSAGNSAQMLRLLSTNTSECVHVCVCPCTTQCLRYCSRV